MAKTVTIEHDHSDFQDGIEARWDLIKVGRKWEVHEIFFFLDYPEPSRRSFGYGPYKTKTAARTAALARRKQGSATGRRPEASIRCVQEGVCHELSLDHAAAR
jgi:hypothetical protein